MKWYLRWVEEIETEDDSDRREHEHWATSWEEVIGYFTDWISKSSNVIKGEVICYLGDKPYGDGKPCLYMNIRCDEVSE